MIEKQINEVLGKNKFEKNMIGNKQNIHIFVIGVVIIYQDTIRMEMSYQMRNGLKENSFR